MAATTLISALVDIYNPYLYIPFIFPLSSGAQLLGILYLTQGAKTSFLKALYL